MTNRRRCAWGCCWRCGAWAIPRSPVFWTILTRVWFSKPPGRSMTCRFASATARAWHRCRSSRVRRSAAVAADPESLDSQLGRAEDAARFGGDLLQRSELPAAGRALALELLAELGRPARARPDRGAVAADSGPAGRSRQPQRSLPGLPRSWPRPPAGCRPPRSMRPQRLQIKEAGGPLAASGRRRRVSLIRCGRRRSRHSINLNDPRRLDAASRALVLPGPRSRTAALWAARQGRSRCGDRARSKTGSRMARRSSGREPSPSWRQCPGRLLAGCSSTGSIA